MTCREIFFLKEETELHKHKDKNED